MVMRPVTPEPLPHGEMRRVLADIKDIKKPKAMPAGERVKQQLKGKGKKEQPVPTPEMPVSYNPFTDLIAEESDAIQAPPARDRTYMIAQGKGQEVAAPQTNTGSAEGGTLSEAGTPAQYVTPAEQTATLPTAGESGTDKAETEKQLSSGIFASMFKKSKKSAPAANETAIRRTATETAGAERTGSDAVVASQDSQTGQVDAQSTVETTKTDTKAATKGTATGTTATEKPAANTDGKSVVWGSTATGTNASFREAQTAQLGGPATGEATTSAASADAQKSKKPKGSRSDLSKRAPKSSSADETTAFERYVTAEERPGPTITASGTNATQQGGGQGGQFAAQSSLNASKTGQPAAEKGKGKKSTMFKKRPKSKGKEQTESIKAAEGLKRMQENVPQINIGEGPVSEEAKQQALERYQAMVESSAGDPLTMLMAGERFGALEAVVAAPPGRVHSVSEDTVLVAKPAARGQHSLSEDAQVAGGRAGQAHALGQDKVIDAKPSRRGAHRLSADAMVPVRTAAPGHYLEADPTVSSPQLLFSHELLEDPRVLRPKSPQPHNLELDKKLAVLQKQLQPHNLHSDTVLPAPQARSAHELHADQVVASGSSAQESHDISHDVRLLSPSGAVRDPHSIDDDEVIKEAAVFRKSPHPDAMMGGKWAAGGEASVINNPMASLNASLQNAEQAMGELNRLVASSDSGKENHADGGRPGMGERAASSPAGHGFWGRVFRRRGSEHISE